MKTAFFVVPEESKPLLATGHNRGFEVVHWHDGGAIIQGAGNLVCSVGDLLTWLEAHLDPPTGPGSLAEALKMTPKPQRDSGDAKLRIGLGWHLRGADPRPIVWHNGGTGGFRSFCGFVPGTGLGVVVLGNSTDDGVDSLGFILIRDLLKPTQQG